ncbi:hypothetical protein TSH100_28805 [Azospirillum sp. TSH100]|uniref:hypothetical protein n=1 Tax=Azospirillum sp. TSH100 TaxID=652764 RepID=UPI000D616D56|nr:hypothetical protein [Azospirillum sp. TSH100]PWC80869.1 hypothetical protein TSH100_28805 [Azospirillum sp. TSH100]QCG88790.1 hypothetical protein E6C72_13140 [Azospirillum sp. TSH100]
MLVYGDQEVSEDPRRRIDRLRRGFADADPAATGPERHGALVMLFIEASELAQGLADREFYSAGMDDRTALQDAGMNVVMALARHVAVSWRSAGTSDGLPDAVEFLDALEGLSALPLPESVVMRRAEGHAFYSLYPEAYLEAAARLPPRFAKSPVMIGLRSIGSGLAAMAAVALNAPAPVSLRPVGHPFQREIRVSERLSRMLLADPQATYVIVDEGPGLSGSSFGTVADWLEDNGVSSDHIAFLPGHDGELGPQASDRHRRRWADAVRPVVGFDELFRSGERPFPPLERWFADIPGPPSAPLEDLSGGRWRRLCGAGGGLPANPQQERRKFLLRSGTGSWLLKFAGLGRIGVNALHRARVLHAAGFTTEPLALRHGIIAERWLDGGQAMTQVTPDAVDRLAHYLAFRARSFPAQPGSGATLPDLLTMARTNIGEALGEKATRVLDGWTADQLADLEADMHRVVTDNRLHRWEWLRLPDGRLMKTDALDHAAAHDLIGCQDIAWDVAGGIVEFDLTDEWAEMLYRAVEEAAPFDRRLLAFCLPCYIAFQIGYWTFAAGSDSSAARERRRYEAHWKRWWPVEAGTG